MNEIKTTPSAGIAVADSHLRIQDRQTGKETLAPAAAPAPSDLVTVTSQAERLRVLEKKLAEMPAVDSEKVRQLRDAIAAGTFRIDPERIAMKLLRSEAETFSLAN